MEHDQVIVGVESSDDFEHVAGDVRAEHEHLRWFGAPEVLVDVQRVGDSVDDGLGADPCFQADDRISNATLIVYYTMQVSVPPKSTRLTFRGSPPELAPCSACSARLVGAHRPIPGPASGRSAPVRAGGLAVTPPPGDLAAASALMEAWIATNTIWGCARGFDTLIWPRFGWL